MRVAHKNPAALAKAIDNTPEIGATVPELNNHGAETTASRLLSLVAEKNAPAKLNLLIAYQNEKLKKRDAMAIAQHLEDSGHTVTMVDVNQMRLVRTENGTCLRQEGGDIQLSSFDGAALRCPTEVKGSKSIADAMRDAGVPIYQDYPMLVAGGDKLLSHKIFEAHDVPTPKTYGLSFEEVPRSHDLERFIDSLGNGPFVVKSNRGWSGEQVEIVDSREDALKAFQKFHAQARKDKVGGALIQEFIESNPERRRDYRIQTVVGVDSSGNPEVQVVAAAKRVAKEGMRITNVSKGADKIRVSLDEAEAREFYVNKNGMTDEEFQKKLENGEIEILTPALKAAAIKAALAFGTGSMGVDVIVGEHSAEPKVIEVNPFAGGSGNFEQEHGFQIYKPWANSFAGFVAHRKQEAAANISQGKAWEDRVESPQESDRSARIA